MNCKIKFLILGTLFIGVNGFAQNKYYGVNGHKPVDEHQYIKLKDEYSKSGKIEEFFLKTEKNKDSIITFLKISNLSTTPDGTDPWAQTKKFIGTKFPIEKFKDNNANPFSKNYLIGKPTLVNFWFTRCPPCIEELPSLNKIKENFGDKVNFISVTFENEKAIGEFMKKYQYNYKHIPNSKEQLEQLGISAYPTNIILDKEGVIKVVNGEITDFDVKEVETTLNTLL